MSSPALTVDEEWRVIARFLRQLERSFGIRIGRDMSREALYMVRGKKIPRRAAGKIPGPLRLRSPAKGARR